MFDEVTVEDDVTKLFTDKLKASNYLVVFTEISRKNHFTMLEQFEFPAGVVHSRIVSALKQ
jgi:arylformamidase